LPEEDQPDRLVPQLLQLLLPSGISLDQLESQYGRLQHELQQIEYKIKSRVEEVRSNVEMEIRHLKTQLVKVNRILSALHFGQIKKIFLELEELPAYHALQKLESLLRIISRGEAVTLKDFVEKLRAFIRKESNTSLTEEQIADYRSYIRIRRTIVDAHDRTRDTGLSSGETLGVNLALCLAVLFFMGREQGNSSRRGMLLLALDEAERLDAKALETIRDLLDEVHCQLTVAMPRPVDISDSICHLLTPLSQGVTHVHLYRRGEESPASARTS
jgi:chromosome partition protein MukB